MAGYLLYRCKVLCMLIFRLVDYLYTLLVTGYGSI